MPRRDGDVFFFGTAMDGLLIFDLCLGTAAGAEIIDGSRAYNGCMRRWLVHRFHETDHVPRRVGIAPACPWRRARVARARCPRRPPCGEAPLPLSDYRFLC